jgi:hypothetical protein
MRSYRSLEYLMTTFRLTEFYDLDEYVCQIIM